MIIIIHGDDIATSRKYFSEVKAKHADGKSFVGETVPINEVMQICEGGGLFEDSKTLFIEQLLSKKKRGRTVDPIIPYLAKQGETNTIILWEGKELTKATLNVFKNATVKLYKLPQTLFLFLDAIKPGNGKQLVSLFHKTIATTETEMVFFMLVRQIRILLTLTSPQPSPKNNESLSLEGEGKGESQIDEVKRMAPWQKGKLQKQANLFETTELLILYQKLFAIEKAQKTGTLSMSLTATIDFLLIEV